MKIELLKIVKYKKKHFDFLKKVYFSNNSNYDLEEGNKTFVKFISIENSNKRIENGSLFFELLSIKNDILGIFELEKNHLTLLYIDNDKQKKGLGSFCINEIVSMLKNKYQKLSVFASPFSLGFYLKNNFVKINDEIKQIKGMNYYSMELDIYKNNIYKIQ